MGCSNSKNNIHENSKNIPGDISSENSKISSVTSSNDRNSSNSLKYQLNTPAPSPSTIDYHNSNNNSHNNNESLHNVLNLYFNNTLTREKMTPLHLAARNGLKEYLQDLIQTGINVNIPCLWEKITPLHLASEYGYPECVKLLIDAGADVNLASFGGLRPLHSAAKNGHVECVDLLIKAGSNLNHQYSGSGQAMTALHDASKYGHTECVRLLINAGANVNLQCSCLTPLHHAAKHGHEECIKLLVEAGTNVNLKCNWSKIRTCQLESNCCKSKFVNTLVRTGATLNLECFKLMSPLHSVIENGQSDCIEILLDYGADLNSANEFGLKPLHTAAQKGKIKCIEILLKNGCDVNLLTEYQNTNSCSNASNKYDIVPHTALFYALLHQQWECVNYLLNQNSIVEDNIWKLNSLPSDIYQELCWSAYRKRWFQFLYGTQVCGSDNTTTLDVKKDSSSTSFNKLETPVNQRHVNQKTKLTSTTLIIQNSELRRFITEFL
mmetsp:Transcript_11741/g.12121  ORF Transcript_11741/g.12121 Transcript_11741/m.12121 type:complete len:494 (-) Transcript_11741:50-1531(-)